MKTDNFFNLPQEKQNTIVDAAMSAFAKNGYKKASVGDIAAAAGVSKAMIFYYFGSKKALHAYLVELCGNTMIAEVKRNLDKSSSDFFDRIRLTTEIKMSVLKQYPSMLTFLSSVYYETDPEAADIGEKIKEISADYTNVFIFDNTDIVKFKESVDPQLVYRFIIWASEGFVSKLSPETLNDEIDGYIEDFFTCLDMMKKNFYKYEYL